MGKKLVVQAERGQTGPAAMILRELLAIYGMRTITEFARRGRMSKAQAWSLWHGRAQLGMQLCKQLAQRTSIPLTRLIELEPTPRTPNRGKGGRRRPAEPPGEEQRGASD